MFRATYKLALYLKKRLNSSTLSLDPGQPAWPCILCRDILRKPGIVNQAVVY